MVSELGQNGVIYTKTNYVTLKYVTDSWGTDANGFTLIITAFRDLNYGCHQRFQCSNSNICISHDLVCDNIHHCVDGADERSSEFCSCKFFLKITKNTFHFTTLFLWDESVNQNFSIYIVYLPTLIFCSMAKYVLISF